MGPHLSDIAFGAVQKRRPAKFAETRMPDAHPTSQSMPSSEPLNLTTFQETFNTIVSILSEPTLAQRMKLTFDLLLEKSTFFTKSWGDFLDCGNDEKMPTCSIFMM